MKNLEMIRTDDLVPYVRNAKEHPEGQIIQIAASLKEFGFVSPVIIDRDNSVVAGHGRILAARRLNMEEVPCIRADHLTHAQIKAYRLVDNKLTMNSGWDQEMLRLEIMDLKDLDFDVELTGFGNDELADLHLDAGFQGQTEDDAVPEVDEKDVWVKSGDLFKLGRHRLLCGDATSKEDVERLMDGQKADMVFTDPPYGVDYEQGKFTGIKVNKKFKSIENDELKGNELKTFIVKIYLNVFEFCNEGSPLYVCSPPMMESLAILQGCMDSGFHMQSQLIWYKNQFILGRADYHWQHELIWYGYKGKNHYWCGDRTQSTVWEIHKDNHSDYEHPTQKPVALSERAIKNSSKNKAIVIDCFAGSGSTLIACEKTNRTCYGCEIDPHYVQIIIERWQDYTGQKHEKIA